MSTSAPRDTSAEGMNKRFMLQREDIMSIRHEQDAMKTHVGEIAQDVQALMAELKELNKVNYPLLILLFSLIPVLGAACLYFVSTQVQSAITPLQQQMVMNQTLLNDKIRMLTVIGNMRYEEYIKFEAMAWQATHPGQQYPLSPYFPPLDTADPPMLFQTQK